MSKTAINIFNFQWLHFSTSITPNSYGANVFFKYIIILWQVFFYFIFFCLIFCCWLYQCHKEKTVNFITLDCTKCDLCQLHEGCVLLWGNTPYRTQGKLHVRANGPKILVNCPIWSWKLITNSHPGPQNESLTMRGAWFNALMIVGWKKK